MIQIRTTNDHIGTTELEHFLFYSSCEVHKDIIDYLKGKREVLDLEIDNFNYGSIHEIPADTLLP